MQWGLQRNGVMQEFVLALISFGASLALPFLRVNLKTLFFSVVNLNNLCIQTVDPRHSACEMKRASGAQVVMGHIRLAWPAGKEQ